MGRLQVRAAEQPSFTSTSDYQKRLWRDGMLLQHGAAQVAGTGTQNEVNHSGLRGCEGARGFDWPCGSYSLTRGGSRAPLYIHSTSYPFTLQVILEEGL